LKLKASGLHEGTLKNIAYCLARIERDADLTKPEEVKLFIANLKVANSYKQNLCKAYNYYAHACRSSLFSRQILDNIHVLNRQNPVFDARNSLYSKV